MWHVPELCMIALVLSSACTGEDASDGTRSCDAAPLEDAGECPEGRVGEAAGASPISGGTLLVTRDGRYAVAASPDTDRVYVVGTSDETPSCGDCADTPKLLARVQLLEGDEPGRIAEDADGRVHVALRRGGALATIDLASGALLARRPVCPSPRGVVYDPRSTELHVACASGQLVTLSPFGGPPVRRIDLALDLRDVVVVPGGLVVSRFKSAELVRLDHDGNVISRSLPTGIERGSQHLIELSSDPLEPAVAWRTVASESGDVYMLHQYGLARPIELDAEQVSHPYGTAGARCGAIVEQSVTYLSPSDELDMGMPMPVSALSVDVALSSDGQWLAVAHPGAHDEKVTIFRSSALASEGRSPVRCAEHEGRVLVPGQPVALALLPGRFPIAAAVDDWLVVQTRAPAELAFYNGFASARVRVDLGEGVDSESNEGHSLFHMDAGEGIACAQCHPEGGEDGRVWHFEPVGARRTQAVHVGLEGTQPFHWEGDQPSFDDLVEEVFVRRMGGFPPSPAARERFERWLFSLTPPPPIVDPASDAAARGRVLFESAAVGCASCHDGPRVGRADSVDVGVESPGRFQVPALAGVGYRSPFLHDGCAETLMARFTPPCGGDDLHGRTSHLSAEELDDLVAYLRSL